MGSKKQGDGKWAALNDTLNEIVAPPSGRIIPYGPLNQWTATGSPDNDPNPFGTNIPALRMPGKFEDLLADDKSLELVEDLLNNATKSPSKQVDAGLAPFPATLGVLPAYDEAQALENYQSLIKMTSVASLYHAIWVVNQLKARGRTQPYRITDKTEAQQAFKDQADAAYQAMTGPLAGIFNISSSVANSFSRHFRKTEIHLGFLEEIFKDYALGEAALLQLDKTLQNFAEAFSNIEITDSSKSDSVCNTVRINQVVKENISGDDSKPLWVWTPKSRIVYMATNYETWTQTIGNAKNGISDQGIDFQMEYVIVDGNLNMAAFRDAEPQLDQICAELTKRNLADFGQEISTDPVRSNN